MAVVNLDTIRNHPFLGAFGEGGHSAERLRAFAVQWFLAVQEHKRALLKLPGLVGLPEAAAAVVIANIHEELGSGDLSNAHTQLLLRFLKALELETPAYSQMNEPVSRFALRTLDHWATGKPSSAMGYFLGLEQVGAIIHPVFLTGVQGAASKDSLAYFNLHSQEEERHAQEAQSVLDFLIEGGELQKVKVQQGLQAGFGAVGALLDGLNTAVFG